MKTMLYADIAPEKEWERRFFKKLLFRAIVGTFFLALFFDVYGGFIRYTFSMVGLTPLIYLPKIAMIVILFVGTVGWLRRSIFDINYLLIFAFGSFFLACIVGISNDLPLDQIIFGFSIFMPLLFGMQLGLVANEGEWLTARRLWIVFGSVILGIFLNFVVGDMPWTGSTYSVGDVVVEANREWTHAEFSRLSGFSRISAQAGVQAAGLGLLVYAVAGGRRGSTWLGIAALLLALVAVLLTTTKSALVALMLVIAILPLIRFRVFSLILLLTTFFMIGLPLAAYSYKLSLDYSNPISQLLLSSFDERLIFTWPITFGLIERYGSWGFGIGLGGVGTPSKTLGGLEQGDALVGDLGLSYTDNLALYMYGNLGLLGIFLLVALVVAIYRLCRSQRHEQVAIGLSALCLLVCGLTVDMMEMLFAPIIFGVALGMGFKQKNQHNSVEADAP